MMQAALKVSSRVTRSSSWGEKTVTSLLWAASLVSVLVTLSIVF